MCLFVVLTLEYYYYVLLLWLRAEFWLKKNVIRRLCTATLMSREKIISWRRVENCVKKWLLWNRYRLTFWYCC